MSTWQYAWLRDDNNSLAVFFSHPQGPNLVPELMAVIGPSVAVAQSSEWVLSLNRQTLNMPYFCGLMGDRGWELVSVDSRFAPTAMSMNTTTTTLYFKRPGSAT